MFDEKELREFLQKQDGELKSLLSEGKSHLKVVDARLMALEQHVTAPGAGGIRSGNGGKSIGQIIIESDGFAALQKGAPRSGRLAVPELKVLSGTWSAAPDYRPVVAFPPQPALPVRALLPNIPTTSNMVEFPVETSFTNAANYQLTEGVDKPQSDATYTLQQQPVATIAHWMAASRQLLDDSQSFQAYIDARLVFMLDKVVEQEILFGTGAAGHLKGLWPSATPATETQTGLVESVGASIGQLAAIGIQPDAVVVNPVDWWAARLAKTTVGDFVLGSPLIGLQPTLWGLRVALAVTMPVGSYLVGNFVNGAAIYDRQQNILEVSREHASFFTQNMVAILVETRMAVCVFVPTAFVRGSVGPGS